MKSILVTGATGLIGSHLMRAIRENYTVFAISRSKPVDGAARTFAVDLARDWDAAALPERIDAVIHLAQSEHYRDFPSYAEEVFRVNTLSTVKLFDYARTAGAKTFVLASSGGIYGTGDQSFSEETAVLAHGDLGFYLGTRLCSEVIAESYTEYINVVSLRFFFVYGPGQRPNMLIPRLVESVRKRSTISVRGEQGLLINPIFVSDAVEAVRKALLLERSYKINVAGPEILSLKAIVETIGAALRIKPAVRCEPCDKVQDLIGNTARMECLLCRPQVAFSSGLSAYLRSIGL